MNLKIKTKDIEVDYKDEYSIIEEVAKKRILELIDSVYQKQKELEQTKINNSSAIGPFSTSDYNKWRVGNLTTELHESSPFPVTPNNDLKVSDPMWFIEQEPLNKDVKLGYSQAVYQIRLMLSSKDEQVNGFEVRKYTEFMISELNKIELNK